MRYSHFFYEIKTNLKLRGQTAAAAAPLDHPEQSLWLLQPAVKQECPLLV